MQKALKTCYKGNETKYHSINEEVKLHTPMQTWYKYLSIS